MEHRYSLVKRPVAVIMGKKCWRTDEYTEFDFTRKAKEVKDDKEIRMLIDYLIL